MAVDILKTLENIEIMENYIENVRPPEHIRAKLDIGYTIENQSIILVEIRPSFKTPLTVQEFGYAKTTFVKNKNCWRVYWMHADFEWHTYEPMPAVSSLLDFLQLVDEDTHHCFKG